jgi:transcriptional regulator with XRE-family HTH domain
VLVAVAESEDRSGLFLDLGLLLQRGAQLVGSVFQQGQGKVAIAGGSSPCGLVHTMTENLGAMLRTERESRGWSRAELARRLVRAADEVIRRQLPSAASLTAMIKQWESGRHSPSPRYRALCAEAFGVGEAESSCPATTALTCSSGPVTSSPRSPHRPSSSTTSSAPPTARSAVDSWAPESARRDNGVFWTRQAAALAALPEPERVVEIAATAAAIASDTGSARLRRELVALGRQASNWAKTPSGRELNEIIATIH